MNLTYKCIKCDTEIDIDLKYNKYIDLEADDTIEDEKCPNCGYENMIEITYQIS